MMAFLFTFGFAALLVVGGAMASLHLRTRRASTGRRLSSLRRAYAAPMGYMTAVNGRVAEDESSRYARKVFVTSIHFLVLLSVILIGVINVVIH